MNPTKSMLKILERVFQREGSNYPAQLRPSKALDRCIEECLVSEVDLTDRSQRLPLTIKGFVLTPFGMMTWCEWCSKNTVHRQ